MRKMLVFIRSIQLPIILYYTLTVFTTNLSAFTLLPSKFITIKMSPTRKSSSLTITQQQQQQQQQNQLKSTTLMEDISTSMTTALNKEVSLSPTSGGGASGGGGASVSAAIDKDTNTRYFIKTAPISSGGSKMLRAEYLGVKEMDETNTIKVPKPIVFGEGGPSNTAFVIFEYLEFTSGGSGYELGVQLANMHKSLSKNKQFGFHVDNTIGATPQPNNWCDNWIDFWDKERLGHMLSLCQNAGYDAKTVDRIRFKTKELLNHNPEPSLLHGDLWGGNKGYAKVGDAVVPVIFDPATYYGDREADVAMTHVFGGFGSDFYQGYEDTWPLPDGYKKRETIYNLYHILNHNVLFGGGYLGQARGMIEKILKY